MEFGIEKGELYPLNFFLPAFSAKQSLIEYCTTNSRLTKNLTQDSYGLVISKTEGLHRLNNSRTALAYPTMKHQDFRFYLEIYCKHPIAWIPKCRKYNVQRQLRVQKGDALRKTVARQGCPQPFGREYENGHRRLDLREREAPGEIPSASPGACIKCIARGKPHTGAGRGD